MVDEPGHRLGTMSDVGVGEQKPFGFRRRGADALLHGPHLAHPTGRASSACEHLQRDMSAGRPAERPGYLPGTVLAGVVDKDDLERARIVLTEQGRKSIGDYVRFIAGRNDHSHSGPTAVRLGRAIRLGAVGIKPGIGAPEHSVAACEHQPDDQGADRARRQHHHDDQRRKSRDRSREPGEWCVQPLSTDDTIASARARVRGQVITRSRVTPATTGGPPAIGPYGHG